MAHTPLEGSSSSLRTTSPSSAQTMSSIQSTKPIVNTSQYRRKVIADGNVVRVFESRRRHCRRRRGNFDTTSRTDTFRTDSSTSDSLLLASLKSDQPASKSLAVQSPVQDENVQPISLAQPRTQQKPLIYMPPKSFGKATTSSSERIVGNSRREDLLTPPPTPRLRRLPTPDLEPMKAREFCDCCPWQLDAVPCVYCGSQPAKDSGSYC
ncbi:hypothetical protein EJ08DRAFT_659446 [Tothia fuscella]|uniref:Uncharacterized protein n=1 Tax=Tothia fuscella TaxID=1048955 RepID=A0A9P4NVV9_9PEZI|nr:hypothetical protein EJ08DRAFT_659446 [Tothia fuscella]